MISKEVLLNYTNTESFYMNEFLDMMVEYSEVSINKEVIKNLFTYKQNYHRSFIPEGSGKTVLLTTETLPKELIIEYKRNIINEILSNINEKKLYVNNLSISNIFPRIDIMSGIQELSKALFSDEELLTGITTKQFKYHNKRIGRGAKITKVINLLESDKDYGSKSVNIFNNLDVKDGEEFIFSVSPIAPLLAGKISESCFSPYGSNSHVTPNLIGMKEQVTVFTSDLSWRALLFINHENKLVYIGAGYPYRKPEYSLLLKDYFEKLGYKIAIELRESDIYLSNDSFFRKHAFVTEEKEFHLVMEPSYILDQNDYPFDRNKTATGCASSFGEAFPYFYNDWDDIYTIDPEEANSGAWSEYHDSYVDPDECYFLIDYETFVYDYSVGDIIYRLASKIVEESIAKYEAENESDENEELEPFEVAHFSLDELLEHLYDSIYELSTTYFIDIIKEFPKHILNDKELMDITYNVL